MNDYFAGEECSDELFEEEAGRIETEWENTDHTDRPLVDRDLSEQGWDLILSYKECVLLRSLIRTSIYLQGYPLKGWDCKDDLKHLEVQSWSVLLYDWTKKDKSFQLHGIINRLCCLILFW